MNFEPKRSLSTQALVLSAATGLSQIMIALIYLWAAKESSPANFGSIVATIGIGFTLAGFIDFGSNSLWVRELAKGSLSVLDYRNKARSKVLLSVLLLSFGALVTLSLPSVRHLWLAAPIALAMIFNQVYQVLLRGTGRSEKIAICILLDRGTTVVVYFFATGLGVTPLNSLWICLIGGATVGGLCGMGLSASVRSSGSRVLYINPWRGAGFFGISSAAISAQSLDVAVMGAAGGQYVAGAFGAVNRLTQPLGLLVSAFTTASAPYLANATNMRSMWQRVRSAIWLPVAAVLACVIAAAAAPWAIAVLLGPAYTESGDVLRIIALGTIPAIAAQPLLVGLQYSGHDRAASLIMAIMVGVYLALSGFLSFAAGAIGAAMALAIYQSLLLAILASTFFMVYRRRP